MTFYKAVRPDGTDFYTGTVDYAGALASGEPVPALPGTGDFPGEGWYHLATVPTECIGMSWPCRLFEVEPVGDQTLDTEHPHKIGCSSVRVVREVDGHIALGPQGHEIVALIGRTWALTGDEAERLGAAWYAAHAARDAARDARGAWYAAWGRDAARGAARDATWCGAWGGGAARGAAWYAARDATLALVSRDLIGHHPGWDQAAYDLLTGPWASGDRPGPPRRSPGGGTLTFYKAVRPDGTDFYTGEVDYGAALASGEPTPALSGTGPFPGRGWYHLAMVPTECAGMSWPCRLFEVEPVGAVRSDTEHPYKIGCAAVRVVREVDGHIALGGWAE